MRTTPPLLLLLLKGLLESRQRLAADALQQQRGQAGRVGRLGGSRPRLVDSTRVGMARLRPFWHSHHTFAQPTEVPGARWVGLQAELKALIAGLGDRDSCQSQFQLWCCVQSDLVLRDALQLESQSAVLAAVLSGGGNSAMHACQHSEFREAVCSRNTSRACSHHLGMQ